MGGPHGQKSVWATAHTAHTVPAPMLYYAKIWHACALCVPELNAELWKSTSRQILDGERRLNFKWLNHYNVSADCYMR